MEISEEDVVKFKEFLVLFSKDHIVPLKDNDILPYRLLSFFLIEEEVEAEVADWVVQYLIQEKTPNLLASLLSHELTRQVMTWNMKPYLEPLPSSQDDDVEAGGDDGSDTDVLGEFDGTPSKTLEIEVSKLAKDVYNRLHELCREWSEDFPTNLFKVKQKLPQGTTQLPNNIVAISSHAIKNTRRRMEDRHLILPYLNQHCGLEDHTNLSLFSVFDGHGGSEAAIYSAAHLHHHMIKHPQFKTNPMIAITEAFATTDEKYIKKAKREQLRSGSTVVSVLFQDSKLHVAWLGDSHVIMVKDGQPVPLMQAHKPEREDERKRIESLGGFVMWFGQWRVNATLSVSRAIGDADFKPFISSTPDTATFDLTGDEDYVILGCDGLWDTMSYDDVANDVYSHLNEKKADKSSVAEMLVARAKEKGSGDNISIVVVFLRDQMGTPKPMPVLEKKVVTEEVDNEEEGDCDQDKSKEKENENAGGPKSNSASHCADGMEENQKQTETKTDEREQNEHITSATLEVLAEDKTKDTQKQYSKSVDDTFENRENQPEIIHSTNPINTHHHHHHYLHHPSKFSASTRMDYYRFTSQYTSQRMLSHRPSAPAPISALGLRKPTPYNVYKVLLKHQHKVKALQQQQHASNTENKKISPQTTDDDVGSPKLLPKSPPKHLQIITTPSSVSLAPEEETSASVDVDSKNIITPGILSAKDNIVKNNSNTGDGHDVKRKSTTNSTAISNEFVLSASKLPTNISTRATKYFCLSDRQSEASSTDIAVVTSAAKRCVSSRKSAKKGKNGKKRGIYRSGADLRRLSRDRFSLGIAERAKSSNTSSSSSPRSLSAKAVLAARYSASSAGGARSKCAHYPTMSDNRGKAAEVVGVENIATSNVKGKSSAPTGSGKRMTSSLKLWDEDRQSSSINRVTAGFSYMDISPTNPESKWTVAREIENAAGMFGE